MKRKMGGYGSTTDRATGGTKKPPGGRLARLLRDLAGEGLLEVKIELDARDAEPAEGHEFIDGDASPLIEGEARDIAKSDARLRVVLGYIPSARSGDVEELCHKARIFFAILRVKRVSAGASFELLEESCRFHRKEGLRSRQRRRIKVEKKNDKEEPEGANPCHFSDLDIFERPTSPRLYEEAGLLSRRCFTHVPSHNEDYRN